ncbi:YheC/YheD family protein [Pseudalkalibacillus sp. JSM 102089]|uniref:YheC/YheD family endospore coat-associated protein n=1 Tax=Pseudalkalibacillus sp. JSM 102089 TaxID=3229856 RepID=UPI003524BA7B
MLGVKPYLQKNDRLIVSKKSHISREVQSEKTYRIQFGIKYWNVTVYHSDYAKEDELHLSTNVIEELDLPLSCHYDVIVQGDTIIIGPFIGILCELTNRKLVELVSTYKSFVKGYRAIGGAVVVFSIEGIQKEKRMINGFLYHPVKKAWEVIKLPYPAVVMSIAEPSLTSSWEKFHECMTDFELRLGGRVFNYPHFSKWEMYQMLQPEFGEYLPETVLYEGVQSVHDMLRRHDSVYIKPLNGRLGKSILNVKKEKHHIIVKYDENRRRREERFESKEESDVFFRKHLETNSFLMQQTIPLKTYEQRVIDFRVMTSKNHKGMWETIGIYSRYGAKGQIVSNITAGGHTEIARATLKTVWKLQDKEIQRVEEEMKRAVLNSIQKIEEQGYHLANIGVDIGLDDNCQISIIEINHQNPDPYIAMMAKDRLAFYTSRYQNMRYARYLGGF